MMRIWDWSERLSRLWERLTSGFWFTPTLMALTGMVLTFGIGAIDWAMDKDGVSFQIIAPEAARAILSTAASSAITVAGVVFSITIVVLSMQASQFGPRLVRNFMRDGNTQVVLGVYITVFICCLLMLGTVKPDGAPQLTVLWGLALGVLSFVFLIYFIHHVALFIQVPRILDNATSHLEKSIRHNFPAPEDDQDTQQPEPPAIDWDQADELVLVKPGYVQLVDQQQLASLAADHDAICRLLRHAGEFVLPCEPVLQVSPPGLLDDEELRDHLQSCFVLGPERTAQQDPIFAVHRLVEVALRALSPSINDPFTAINCVDRLAGALGLLAKRRPSAAVRCDDEGHARLLSTPTSFCQIIDQSFNQLRQVARSDTAMAIHLLKVIGCLGQRQLPDDMRQALNVQNDAIYHGIKDGMLVQKDREAFQQAYETSSQQLDAT